MSKDKRYSIQGFDESLLGAMPFAVDIVDQDLNILYMNEELEAKVGKEAIGRKCYKIYKDDGVQCLGCPLAKPMNTGEVNFIEVGGTLGGRTVRITHRAIEIKGKTAILEVFEDITERKALRELEKNYEFQLMNKEKLAKIFEPHFTTKATADEAGEDEPVGTGLGLYMVRELLKKYQAEYGIKSQLGKGTTFTVKFPIGNSKGTCSERLHILAHPDTQS